MSNKKYAILSAVVILILILLACFKLIIDDEYKAQHSLEYYKGKTKCDISVDDNLISTKNENVSNSKKEIGIIIYGAEKIQREAYIPLMTQLSDYGYYCFFPTASGNMPLLNIDGANSIIQSNDSIEIWVIVGHSYGAESAARFISKHPEIISFIMLAGAGDKASCLENIKILSIIGSKDGIINMDKYNSLKVSFLSELQEEIIPGGNHTYFADAEIVSGDFEADITADMQISETADIINSFIEKAFDDKIIEQLNN